MTRKTHWNWLRDQELIAARNTPAAQRTRWQQLIIADDDRMVAEAHHITRVLEIDINV